GPCYGLCGGRACEQVRLYLCDTEDARRQLLDYGVPGERIKICGIPIHPKFQFQTEADKQATRVELGLDPEKFTVFINAGWVGGGNIPRIFEEMVERGEQIENTQAIFLAGRNHELQERIAAVARRAPFPTKVTGYTNV